MGVNTQQMDKLRMVMRIVSILMIYPLSHFPSVSADCHNEPYNPSPLTPGGSVVCVVR